MSDLTGLTIDRYRIIEKLGQGGMAVVYKAYDTRLQRDVALKVIRLDAIGKEHHERLLKRFEREAVSQAKFIHSSIISVHDYGEHEGAPYLVMEYLSGGTLKQLTGQSMPYQEALQLLLPIADALAYAHKQNILHRDVKPANILITDEGVPMLTDFGIAKLLETEEDTLTGTGMGVGTPEYMAPEQWRGEPVTQTDIYALGVVLYELITGRKPYTADTPAAIIIKQINDPLPLPTKYISDLPEQVERVLLTALAVNPEDRYQNMEALAVAMRECLTIETAKKTAEKLEPEEIPVQQVELTDSGPTFDSLDTPPAEHPEPEIKTEKPKKKLPRWVWGLLGGLILLVILALTGLGEGDWSAAMRTTNTPIVMTVVNPTLTPTATATPIPQEAGLALVNDVDGAAMVSVPAGEFSMGSEEGKSDERPVHTVYLDAFWIYQTEVTNALYQLCVEADACSPPDYDYFGDEAYSEHPVVGVSWQDAVDYCEWAGGRLPTEAEWEKAARGTEGLLYPWGEPYNSRLANNCDVNCPYLDANADDDDGYERTAPVGRFPDGASPYGALDMAGNVSEWVMDWYAEDYQSSPDQNPAGPLSGQYRVLRGGSWTDVQDDLRAAARQVSQPGSRSYGYGFRCVHSAFQPIPAPTEIPTAIEDMEAVETRMNPIDEAVVVYVPEGEFLMGSEDGYGDESPVHPVYLNEFWIYQTEVTNKQYRLCVEVGVCEALPPGDWEVYAFSYHPVGRANWFEAVAYCEWAGGRLPTEAEWEKAARGGLEGMQYPWGNEDPVCDAGVENGAQFSDCGSEPVPVSSFGPNGYGLYDMAGNVWEWVADWYDSDYYQNSPYGNPAGPFNEWSRILRGGSWRSNQDNLRVASRFDYSPDQTYGLNFGFRCVIPAQP